MSGKYLMPIEQAGPDVVFRVGKEIWLIQSKYVKYLYGDDFKKAMLTVDPDYFYTCRSIKSKSFGKVLPGFETVAQEVKKAIAKFKLRQVVISTMDNNTRIDLDKTKLVTPRSEPNFFSNLGEEFDSIQIWDRARTNQKNQTRD